MSTDIKYKPKNLNDFVWPTDELREQVEYIVAGNVWRPVILYGPPGTGKSLLANLIPKAIDGENVLVEKIAAEELNSQKAVREKFTRNYLMDKFFTWGDGQSRLYILIEEVNFEGKAKDAFRVVVDEMIGYDQVLITTNEIHNLDRALRSRSEQIEVLPVVPDKFFDRAKFICDQEGLEIDDGALMSLLHKVYDAHKDNREYYKALDILVYKAKKALNVNKIYSSVA